MTSISYDAIINRRNLIVLAIVDVAAFFIANMTAHNAHNPGTVSNVFWGVFLIGTGLLVIALATAGVMGARRLAR